MIKKVVKLTFIAAVAVAAGYTAYSHSQKAETLSDLTLDNVEALASNESGGDCNGCYTTTLEFCKFWGWGGCIGDRYIHYS